MKINRMFEIVYLLLERGSMTAAALAEHFEVSPRTIYRDIDALSAAGVPVYASKGRGGALSLMPNFVLNKSLLTDEEQNEILFALQSMKAASANSDENIASRLQSFFQKDCTDWIDVDFSDWGSGAEAKQDFMLLKKGIMERRVVAFDYYSARQEKTRRMAEPVMLRFKIRAWYLYAYCRMRQQYRTFKLNRMRNVNLMEEHFLPREDALALQSVCDGNWPPSVAVTIWFAPETAYRVYDEFSRRCCRQNEDGSFTVTVYFPEDNWLYGYLLSFGESAKVLSPPRVQFKLAEKVRQMAKRYQDVSEVVAENHEQKGEASHDGKAGL